MYRYRYTFIPVGSVFRRHTGGVFLTGSNHNRGSIGMRKGIRAGIAAATLITATVIGTAFLPGIRRRDMGDSFPLT